MAIKEKTWRPQAAFFLGFGFAVLVALRPATGRAEDRIEHLAFDSTKSWVDFEVKVLWLVGVHGRFGSVHGTISVDHFRGAATVEAQIDANVVSMRSKSHEEWVKSPEFFDAEHYPQIAFISDAIPLKRLQSGGEIGGMLTLRGVNRRVQFNLIKPDCPAAVGDNCPIEAEGSIRRSDFGMSSRRGTLSDKVDLSFSIATKPATGGSQP